VKRIVPALCLFLFSACAVLGAGPNEEYVRIYTLIQKAQTLEDSDRDAEALALYLDAEQSLMRIKRVNPQWNPKVVDFRLRFLQGKIAALKPAESPEAALVSTATAAPAGGAEAAPLRDEIERLNRELEQLHAQNSALHDKLKEALSVRPAATNPRQLEEAEERNAALIREVELLKSQLAQAQVDAGAASASEALKAARATTADLAAERTALVAQVTALTASAEAADALREENALLKRQLADLQSTASASGETGIQRQLDEVLTELAMLRSEADVLRLEKSALEQRMVSARSQPEPLAGSERIDSRERIAALERERDQLQAQLARANQDLAALSAASVGEPNGLAQAEIERLEARLAVYEEEKVPYSPEELVLFRMSRGMETSKAIKPAPPTGMGPLVAQAERQFKQGDFRQAEVTLKEMLEADDSNAFTLANLAATQMEQGKDAEAEANLRKALASESRDPFTLATLGILKFRQHRYEEALDYLGLAAQYNPDSAVIHNYLGMALSEQGMRGPAETALRRAIQLQPGFGDAHFNLALVYILQDPPLPELARWHYQKALQVGHERSAQMEQLLDGQAAN